MRGAKAELVRRNGSIDRLRALISVSTGVALKRLLTEREGKLFQTLDRRRKMWNREARRRHLALRSRPDEPIWFFATNFPDLRR